ncbi:polycystic kidney disease protein 1-like 2, partial [Biomphalaria glabrata]
ECLCEDGWQGDRCDVSIDDCIWKPCGGMLCLDLHRTFSCICGENKRFIRGKCR